MFCAFDTETTGVANFRAPASDPSQPRIVQLGAILFDNSGRVVSELNLLVKPEGFTIPAEASAIHGITTEIADRYGLRIPTVIKLFSAFVERSELLVAHNFDFDKLLVASELHRIGAAPEIERFLAKKSFCTMKSTTDICRIPGMRGYKWPKLEEAYRFFFNETFVGAHDAMADVRACARVFFHLQKTRGIAA